MPTPNDPSRDERVPVPAIDDLRNGAGVKPNGNAPRIGAPSSGNHNGPDPAIAESEDVSDYNDSDFDIDDNTDDVDDQDTGADNGAEANTISLPGFTDEELRNIKVNLNKNIRYYQVLNPKTGKPRCIVTNKEGMRQVLGYAMLRKAMPAHEIQGAKFAARAANYITSAGGSYLRDKAGRYHIILDGKRIPIHPDSEDMQEFFRDVCKITTLSPEARVAIQHIKVLAHKQAADMEFRRFSAIYDGKTPRVYLPVAEPGKILLVTPDDILLVPNGNNQDQLWLEHPEHAPFKWQAPADDPEADIVEVHAALTAFEEIFVRSQACAVPAMRWFVAMNEGLFPFVRDACSTRFITLHRGNFGSGKTSAAENFSLLHGLGEVLGDVSVAALNNSPERGLVILDNKESDSFTKELIYYLLFLATGGQTWRSSNDGESIRQNTQRPVCVITSIEGASRAELQNRIVEVEYFLQDGSDRMERGPFKEAINKQRDRIMSMLAVVLQEYLRVRVDPAARRFAFGVNPVPRFGEHFRELCYLMVAFARQRNGSTGDAWAQGIILEWDAAIRSVSSSAVDTSSEYEAPIREVIRTVPGVRAIQHNHNDRQGMLYITEADDLLTALRKLDRKDLSLPVSAKQFGNRLSTEAPKFRRCSVLRDPEGTQIPELKRHGDVRPLGIWMPIVE